MSDNLKPPFTADKRTKGTPRPGIRMWIGIAPDDADAIMADFDRVCVRFPGALRSEVARRVLRAGLDALLVKAATTPTSTDKE